MQNWDYYGIFPPGATSRPFWGIRGIVSTTGTYAPSGVLSADTTTPTTPDTVVITCSAIYTSRYEWQRKVGGTWTPLLGQTAAVLEMNYVLGDAGTYQYRCKLTGWAGTAYTEPITITVSEPVPVVIITADKQTLVIGETATLSAAVLPRPEYARSIEWQQSTDGTTWTEAGTGDEYVFTPETAGLYYFRAIGIGYGEPGTSNTIEITVSEPEP